MFVRLYKGGQNVKNDTFKVYTLQRLYNNNFQPYFITFQLILGKTFDILLYPNSTNLFGPHKYHFSPAGSIDKLYFNMVTKPVLMLSFKSILYNHAMFL